MRRVTDFLVRNWPLKVGAILLATVLYSGLVLGQNVRTWTGTVPVEEVRQPAGSTLIADLAPVTEVRYRAPLDVGVISPNSFYATVDLSGVVATASGPPSVVPITLIALDSRIQIVDFQPRQLEVRLDPVTSKTLPVTVDVGAVPDGLNLSPPQTDPSTATVLGASSRIDQVAAVVARVSIDASALNVDREFDLVAVDSNGNQVPNVQIEPQRTRIRIAVARELATRTLPVVPQITGQPAAGFRITSVTVEPLVVTVSGEESTITQLQTAPTEAIDITGRNRDLESIVRFALPDGVSVSGSDTARVIVTIAEVTGTRTFEVGVVMTGEVAGNTYDVTPLSVQVTLAGPISALDAFGATQPTASVDVTAVTGSSGAFPVAVFFEPPPGLTVVLITPEDVTVAVDTLLAASFPAPTP